MTPKQLIIVRNDLRSKLRHGKLAAQVAHASMAAVIGSPAGTPSRFVTTDDGEWQAVIDLNEHTRNWLLGSFTKIVLRADDEAHMNTLFKSACDVGIPASWIKDSGRTVFQEPTSTCIGVGPWDADVLDAMFGHLKMY